MVSFTDLKIYDSQNGLGGAIDTGDPVQNATPNNLFSAFTRNEIIAGSDKYACFYMKNESSERMENFKIWLSAGTPLDITAISMGYDAIVNPFDSAVGFDGTNDYIDCGNDAALWSKPLTRFAFAVRIWPNSGGNDRYVVNHGGSAIHGFRLIYDADNDQIRFLIKDAAGNNHTVYAPITRGRWSEVICSYWSDVSTTANIRIYVDGVLEDSDELHETINLSTSLILGESSTDYYGYMKDFKWWNTNISTTGASEYYNTGDITGSTEAYHLDFSERSGSTTTDDVSGTKTATLNGAFWKNTAQTIGSPTSSPKLRGDRWWSPGEIETKTFRLDPGDTIPIWVRVTLDADPEAHEFIDDNGIFTIRFDVTPSGTGSGGSGGTGGGTGGNTTTFPNYKVAFAGDWGNTGDTTDVVNLLKSQDYDFIVGVGDNAYDDSSASSWVSKFGAFKGKFISAYGNHEYEDGGMSTYKSFFGKSATYYSYRWQNILFLIIDSNDDKSGVDLDAQRTFFKNELEKYKNDPNVVWRIAAMHHPWFGSGGKHDENEFDQVQKFHKLFTDYDVAFVYTGHNHNWHRSHQVAYDSGSPTSPNLVDSSSPYVRTAAGLMQINSGMGGHDDPDSSYSLPSDASFWAYRNKSNNGVHELVASNNGNTLTGRYRNIDKNTFDTFTITA